MLSLQKSTFKRNKMNKSTNRLETNVRYDRLCKNSKEKFNTINRTDKILDELRGIRKTFD